ncbi:unnamed protein product [Adineta ricciae]|uniref:Uncharacterized protein n=1 Tax=Adineta ricciae TaxID=249248 RepID=A0A816D8V1_ADIRI|nr:unnamed protein product [Adineta ricciae]CAF1631095.1 unnamed protein product [Adineta ricciae]
MAVIVVAIFFIATIVEAQNNIGSYSDVTSIEARHLIGPQRPLGSCPNGNCDRSSSKWFLIPLIISIVALCLGILLAGILIWFCLRRRRNRNKKDVSNQSNIIYADEPPIYKIASETND